MHKIIALKKSITIFLSILILLSQNACNALKPKKVSAKEFPPDPKERVKKNIEEGKGFRLMGGNKSGTTYEFASSNPLWQATLETLDFMPMTTVDYAGGMIISDWYSDNSGSSNESLKITVRFLSNEVRSDSIKIIVHKKICKSISSCNTTVLENSTISQELTSAINKKAAIMQKEDKEKK